MADHAELCPHCGQQPERDKWVCQCGAILNLDVLRHEKPADRLPGSFIETTDSRTPIDEPDSDQPTLKFDPVHGLSEVFTGRVAPIRVPDIDVFSLDLSPMDLYLYSKIDGTLSAAELTGLTGLKQVEMGVVLLTLMRAGAITTTRRVNDTLGPNNVFPGEEKAEQIRQAAADNARRQYERFRECCDSGDVEGATLHLKRAVASSQDHDYIQTLEEHLGTTVKWCDEVYRESRSLLTQGKTGGAIALLQKGVSRFPAEAGFYNLLAIAIVANDNDLDLAAVHLRRARELDPNNPVYAQNLRKLEAGQRSPPPTGLVGRLRRLFGSQQGRG